MAPIHPNPIPSGPPVICLAHDGSMNDDWVGRYALRMAHHTGQDQLTVFSVRDGAITDQALDLQLGQFVEEGEKRGLKVSVETLQMEGGVAQTLASKIPRNTNTFLLCGARVREYGRGLLSGTVSEALLRQAPCHVLAIRVVNPGIMGAPGSVLFPLSENPLSARRALPFLRLLGPDLQHLRLLSVVERRGIALRNLSWARHQQLLQNARDVLTNIEDFYRRELQPPPIMEHTAAVSDDWPKEAVIEANKAKSRLILLGATERSLPVRFLFGNPYEEVLHRAPCDVAVFRSFT